MEHPKKNYFIKEIVKWFDDFYPKRYKINRSRHGCSTVTGPIVFGRMLADKNITVYPSKYFYPICWSGIKDINLHKKIDLPKESFMFQYGLTTNGLEY